MSPFCLPLGTAFAPRTFLCPKPRPVSYRTILSKYIPSEYQSCQRFLSLSTHRRLPSTISPSANPRPPLLLFPSPRNHPWLPADPLAQLELGAAGQTLEALGDLAEDAEADTADVAQVDDAAVAEAGGSEVDVDQGGRGQVVAGLWRGEEGVEEEGQERGGVGGD